MNECMVCGAECVHNMCDDCYEEYGDIGVDNRMTHRIQKKTKTVKPRKNRFIEEALIREMK